MKKNNKNKLAFGSLISTYTASIVLGSNLINFGASSNNDNTILISSTVLLILLIIGLLVFLFMTKPKIKDEEKLVTYENDVVVFSTNKNGIVIEEKYIFELNENNLVEEKPLQEENIIVKHNDEKFLEEEKKESKNKDIVKTEIPEQKVENQDKDIPKAKVDIKGEKSNLNNNSNKMSSSSYLDEIIEQTSGLEFEDNEILNDILFENNENTENDFDFLDKISLPILDEGELELIKKIELILDLELK